ncbi:MAG: hypothetical protein JWQ17_644 [Tardiphaga sp.]|nr:hypothetical protein [Tardiphaga sp.]
MSCRGCTRRKSIRRQRPFIGNFPQRACADQLRDQAAAVRDGRRIRTLRCAGRAHAPRRGRDRHRQGDHRCPANTLNQRSSAHRSVRVGPCKCVEDCRLRWRPRQSLASSCEPSLAWRPVTAVAKRRQGGVGRNEVNGNDDFTVLKSLAVLNRPQIPDDAELAVAHPSQMTVLELTHAVSKHWPPVP